MNKLNRVILVGLSIWTIALVVLSRREYNRSLESEFTPTNEHVEMVTDGYNALKFLADKDYKTLELMGEANLHAGMLRLLRANEEAKVDMSDLQTVIAKHQDLYEYATAIKSQGTGSDFEFDVDRFIVLYDMHS